MKKQSGGPISRNYDPAKIEKKWQKKWEADKLYKTKENSGEQKRYILDMFPYPSGEGLHVGHPKGYIATDIVSRFYRMNGFSVLHPMGFDAFGLPAENYALKTKTNPMDSVKKNVKRFKEQLEVIGLDYDWSREINTTDPEYYRWTQWIFIQLWKKGLAFESYEPINWCPSCKTGLANEDIEDGHCERCGTLVEKKPMRQWVLKITDYAERLLNDLDAMDGDKLFLDWPESIKILQRNWIGRSEGALIKFKLIINSRSFDAVIPAIRQLAEEIQCQTTGDVSFGKTLDSRLRGNDTVTDNSSVEVFTTRPDTLFGVTYLVLAPEYKLVKELLGVIENKKEVEDYINRTKDETEIERTDAKKEKTGVELKGVKAVNPANNEKVSVWIADYVLADYGTGAVMAVPAHDERDWEFAKRYNLPIKHVITSNKIQLSESAVFVDPGVLVNSGRFDGKDSESIKKEITESVGGKWVTKYKLRDWVFSRQRYWGEPIPMIHCEKCALRDPSGRGSVPVPEKDLPVKLPRVRSYEPTGTGESPLTAIEKWVKMKCPVCKGPARRETNTMPQLAGSSWYYLRYEDPKNKKNLVDAKREKYWSPVDLYVGGAEHATRHLIYARFWHKFLYDIGAVSTIEPFKKLQHVGLIMGEDGRKMSKRFGNVINPDDIVKMFGADTLRLYEMFMGPFDQQIAWSTESIVGTRRFIEKVWRMKEKVDSDSTKKLIGKALDSRFRGNDTVSDSDLNGIDSIINKTVKKVSEDIELMRFNTAMSAMMIAVNEMEKAENISRKQYETILQLLAPFAPHVTEELWHAIGNKKSIHISSWPIFDPDMGKDLDMKIMVQVNGKVRGSFMVNVDKSEDEVKKMALDLEETKKWIVGKEVKKVIVVKGKLVSIVI
ncbi:MAG: leucine--tRNA ligase [Candidatus Taylorbacteria bacterium]|nr:leucine--tRNA ligase [Candidatus Taylorbacteria bacterium]